MKKILFISFILTIATLVHSAENYSLLFKPNENLKYKIQIHPFPDEIGYSAAMKLTSSISEYNIVTMSIKENQNSTFKLLFNLKMLDKKSCCDPLTYPGYFYTIDNEIENTIKPTGEFIDNRSDSTSIGCIFGFNLAKFNRNTSKGIKPYIIPFYFPEKEISINTTWTNEFVLKNEGKETLFINYSLKSISDNIAYIEGSNLQGLHVTSHFDIIKGRWIDFKMFQVKDSKEYLFKSYELTE